MSPNTFDPISDQMFIFDVGEDKWESIYRLLDGANYGWAFKEGSHPFRPSDDADLSFEDPVIEHSHAECKAICGGAIYRGSQFPQLANRLIYADYASGAIFASDVDVPPCSKGELIALTGKQILDVCTAPDGEVLVLTADGTIARLIKHIAASKTAAFPEKLSDTGIFDSVEGYEVATGVISYSVNSPLFSDDAQKVRHLAVPDSGQLKFHEHKTWDTPDGTVFVKTFVVGQESLKRRIETRLLHREYGTWRGYSYQWNSDQTDAVLVGASGATNTYADEHGNEQTWIFPSRTDCMGCHTAASGYLLGINTRQLNRQIVVGDLRMNQLEYFDHLGLFSGGLPQNHRLHGLVTYSRISDFPQMAEPFDEKSAIEDRASSYLDANCSHCHRRYGGGNSRFTTLHSIPMASSGVINALPQHGSFGIPEAKLVYPGEPSKSILLYRMMALGKARMPRLGTSRVDRKGARLIEEWIESLEPKMVAVTGSFAE